MSRAGIHAAVVVVLAGACASSPSPPPAPSAAAERQEDVAFAPLDADVWAWDVEVSGALPAGAAFTSCRVGSGRGAIDARVEGGVWSARLPLAAGANAAHAECVDDRGRVHRSVEARLRAMLRDAPAARIAVEARGGDLRVDAAASAPSAGSGAPIASYAWSVESGGARVEPDADARGARVVLEGDASAVVRLDVRDARGAADVARVRVGRRSRAPGDAVVYGVVPPLFGAPPLRAVTARLAELAELGVDVLWLSPIFDTPPNDYGYAVKDYFRVRSEYGTPSDLADLVRAAHARDLRVILDLVPNHTSDRHRYFVDADELGRISHYYSFYERNSSGAAEHYFDWTNLPNLHYGNPEVANWMLEATAFWLRGAAVDGYRVDAAWGVERRYPAFWDAFVAEARRLDPDGLLVAEASARDPFWREHGFDAAYDWTDELGHGAWEEAFDDPDGIADRLDAAVRASPSRVLRFLENNDTGPRFVTRHGADLTRVAAAALLTLPGTPSLFTGQERGAEYEPYARREPLDAADPHALRPWYEGLLALRRRVPALRGDGYVRARTVAGDARVFAYARFDDARRSFALVVLRFDDRPARVRIDLPEAARATRAWREALGDRPRVASRAGAVSLDLAPWDVRVLVAE